MRREQWTASRSTQSNPDCSLRLPHFSQACSPFYMPALHVAVNRCQISATNDSSTHHRLYCIPHYIMSASKQLPRNLGSQASER
jgi:hypothetical protein